VSISSYSDLKTAVADWLMRDDLTDRIPDFITFAEARFNRVVEHPKRENRATATVQTTSTEPEFVSLPSDFQSMRRVRLNGVSGKPGLQFLSEEQLNEQRFAGRNTAAQPKFYTIFGSEMELVPTPDQAYELEIVYRQNLTALSTSNTSNWLLSLAPDVYLYGALLQSAPFMQDDERLQSWGAAYKASLDELNAHGNKVKFGGSILSISVNPNQVTP